MRLESAPRRREEAGAERERLGEAERSEGSSGDIEEAEISQITNGPGPDCVVNLFLFLVE